MYPRRGPPKSTPTDVLCQKCLKRGHYSYECKVAPQDRPYKARPSRSQQLRNPKLAPKLHEETFNALELKKGVADEELAKREAERALKRRRTSKSVSLSSSGSESDDSAAARRRRPKGKQSSHRRRRSPSYSDPDSGSTSGSGSPSATAAAAAAVTSSPRGYRRPASVDSLSPSRPRSRSHSHARSASSYSSSRGSRSPSPPPASRVSPPRERERRPARPHDDRMKSSDFFGQEDGADRGSTDRRRHRDGSRSPVRERDDRRSYRQRDDDTRGDGDRRDRQRQPPAGRGREQTNRDDNRGGRQRSLSPFSKRLALTKHMKSG